MAFCNSCGATIDGGTKFCNKCGAAAPVAAASVPVASAPPAAQSGGGGAIKIILIVVAVIVGLGILGFGTAAFFIHRAISRTHIEERNGKVKIDSPYGSVNTSDDSSDVSSEMGVAMYPGADVVKGTASSMDIGSLHTVTVQLQTDDSPSTVAAYYKEKLTNVSYSGNQGDHYTMMAGDKSDMTTLSIGTTEGKTRIQISKMVKK
jgi:hypothetical protein